MEICEDRAQGRVIVVAESCVAMCSDGRPDEASIGVGAAAVDGAASDVWSL